MIQIGIVEKVKVVRKDMKKEDQVEGMMIKKEEMIEEMKKKEEDKDGMNGGMGGMGGMEL